VAIAGASPAKSTRPRLLLNVKAELYMLLVIGGTNVATKRKFAKQPKTKGGVNTKYVKGAKNKKAAEAEIKSTAKKYKEGKLTPAEMDRIAKRRSKNVTKSYKKASEKRRRRLA